MLVITSLLDLDPATFIVLTNNAPLRTHDHHRTVTVVRECSKQLQMPAETSLDQLTMINLPDLLLKQIIDQMVIQH